MFMCELTLKHFKYERQNGFVYIDSQTWPEMKSSIIILLVKLCLAGPSCKAVNKKKLGFVCRQVENVLQPIDDLFEV